ncbi:MAG: glycosyltransferase family 4 protein [Acidimicrobiia bacterium]
MRIAVLNQFYAPDQSPTAQLAASLAEHRAAMGDDVTVLTGAGDYVGDRAPTHRETGGRAERDRRAGRASASSPGGDGCGAQPHDSSAGAGAGDRRRPRVVRLWHPGTRRRSTVARLADYLSFCAGALVRAVALRRQDVVVVMTTPPFLLVAAIAHKVLHPGTRVVLWSMDCYPDVAERYGTIRPGGPLSRVLAACNRALYRRLDHVVCLDGAMRDLLASRYRAAPGRPEMSVVPNWERVDLFPPAGADVEPWDGYAERVLAGRFVVLYQGNLGYGHRYDSVLAAAARLVDEDVVFLFVGGGFRRRALEADAEAAGLTNIVLRPYLPKSETPGLLAGAGASLILLDDAALGVMSPSKLHSSLAMGVPVLYAGPRGSNVDEAVERFGCGFSVRADDVDALVAALRTLRDDPAEAETMGRRARAAFEEAYSDVVALPCFDAVLGPGLRLPLVTSPAPP